MKKLTKIFAAGTAYIVTASLTYILLAANYNPVTNFPDDITTVLLLLFEALIIMAGATFWITHKASNDVDPLEILEEAEEPDVHVLVEAEKQKLKKKPTEEELSIRTIEAKRQSLLQTPASTPIIQLQPQQQIIDDGYNQEPTWDTTPTTNETATPKLIQKEKPVSSGSSLNEIYEEMQKQIVVATAKNYIRQLNSDKLYVEPNDPQIKKFGGTHFTVKINHPKTEEKPQQTQLPLPLTMQEPKVFERHKGEAKLTPQQIARMAELPEDLLNGQ